MIGKLKGVVDSYGEDHVILDVHGVGYLVHCSARTLQQLPPVGEAAASRVKVNTMAARAQSATLDPTKRQAAGKSAASAKPALAPHRQQSGPAPSRGKTR